MIKYVNSMIKHVSSMIKTSVQNGKTCVHYDTTCVKYDKTRVQYDGTCVLYDKTCIYFAADIDLYIFFLLKITNNITSCNSVHLIWNILYIHAPICLHSVLLNEEQQQFSTAIIILSLRHIQTSLFHFNNLGCTSSTGMEKLII
jgi:hypothetical protein